MAVAIWSCDRAGRFSRRHLALEMNSKARIEFGDFQTPLPLAREVCKPAAAEGVAADVIIEPPADTELFLLLPPQLFHVRLCAVGYQPVLR